MVVQAAATTSDPVYTYSDQIKTQANHMLDAAQLGSEGSVDHRTVLRPA